MGVTWQVTNYTNALMPPVYLSTVSAWHGHIPFAFWLSEVLRPKTFVELGVHAGDSYMAWCQGLSLSGESCRAEGIDTFEGDEQTGDYSNKMYEMVSGVHNPTYGDFSTLIESRFEDHVNNYADGQIDLLHIDGCHTFEAVERDFNMWLPKMSPRGVVVMHDTNVTTVPGFGVWQKWDELNIVYPAFEFYHSSGLGMLLVGEERNELLAQMCAANGTSEGQWIREFFELLAGRVHAQRNSRPN